MSFDAIKKEVATLDDQQLADLAVLVKVIRNNRDPEYRAKLAQKMDQPKEAWFTEEDLEARFGPLDAEGE